LAAGEGTGQPCNRIFERHRCRCQWALKPLAVGDLLLAEQELRRYELGELADIESIMRGERRERTLRNLGRGRPRRNLRDDRLVTDSAFERYGHSTAVTAGSPPLRHQARTQAASQLRRTPLVPGCQPDDRVADWIGARPHVLGSSHIKDQGGKWPD
jgi:hypothetical protein